MNKIRLTLNDLPNNVDIEELNTVLSENHFQEGVYKNATICNNNWLSQQLFSVVMQEKDTNKILQDCSDMNLMPTLIAKNSSNENEIFFVIEHLIADIRVRELIQKSLTKLFTTKSTKKSFVSKMHSPLEKVVWCETLNTISVASLVYNVTKTIRLKAGDHANREIKKYCQYVGLNILNGQPYIETFADKSDFLKLDSKEGMYISLDEKLAENQITPRINNIYRNYLKTSQFFEGYLLYFNKDYNVLDEKLVKVEQFKDNRDYLIQNFDFQRLADNCKLYREFYLEEKALDSSELFLIVTNLLQVKEGKSKILEVLQENKDYAHELEKHKAMINTILKGKYKATSCSGCINGKSYCPYNNTCLHGKNLLEQGKLYRGHFQTLGKRKKKTIEEAKQEFKNIFHGIMENDSEGVYIIKAPTGFGKTYEYIQACKKYSNTTIALPTHRLINEVGKKMKQEGVIHSAVPELPNYLPEDIKFRLEHLYNIGAYRSAKYYLKSIAKDNSQIEQYLKNLSDIKEISNEVILTTHQRCLYSSDYNKTLIVDEDIIPSMFPTDFIRLSDFKRLVDKAKSAGFENTWNDIYLGLLNSQYNVIQDMSDYNVPKTQKVEKLIAGSTDIRTNILGFLNSYKFIKTKSKNEDIKEDFIHFIRRRELPNKKIIILSATLTESIAKKVFGSDVKFFDIGDIETKGRVVQVTNKSFSRTSIKEDPEGMKRLGRNLIYLYNQNNEAVITYMDLKQNDGDMHLWATQGIDSLRGKNITVVGTTNFNPINYVLFCAALGVDIKLSDIEQMEYQPVEYENHRFYYTTYRNNKDLRDIQFYKVGSELIQAVGRARHLREDVTVLVLSNFPIDGAEFITLSENEIKEYKKIDLQEMHEMQQLEAINEQAFKELSDMFDELLKVENF